jgi:carbamoyl-phosphate synthase large subunit
VAKRFSALDHPLYATWGTAAFLRGEGIPVTTVYRISEGRPPDALGLMRRGEVKLVINTPTEGSGSRRDGYMMRRLAVDLGIPFITTVQGARAAAAALEEVARLGPTIRALQEWGELGRMGMSSGGRRGLPQP